MVLLRSRTGPAFNSEAGQAASPTLTPAPATSADCAAPPPTPATPAPRPEDLHERHRQPEHRIGVQRLERLHLATELGQRRHIRPPRPGPREPRPGAVPS